MRVIPVLLLILSILGFSSAQNDCPLRIGTNLAGPADYGSEWPLVDIMKYARTWTTHNAYWVGGGQNPWDTQALGYFDLDEHGWPMQVPVGNIPGTEAPQIVLTVWANTSVLPEGVYTLLYEGEGEIVLQWDAQVIAEEPGRMEVQVTPGVANIMALEIHQTSPANHLRNIRFLMPGTETTHEEQIWCAEWMDKLAPFSALRFMDWGYTNNSPLESWTDRALIDDYVYTDVGMPYELMIRACNDLQKDAWVCIPHRADDDYIQTMAELFRDQLDPGLKLYIEYSNETWNWLFEQTHYLNEEGDQNTPWPERTVPFVQNALDIWSEVFANEMERITRVVGVQHSWQDVSNRVVFNMTPGSFDAFAPAAYFHIPGEGHAALKSMGSNVPVEEVLYWARQGMLNEAWPWTISQQTSIADELGIPMLYYEGGQHLTPDPWGTDQNYGPAMVAAQRDSGMYTLYREWLDSLATLGTAQDPGLLMHFSYIGVPSQKYGSFGSLECQFCPDDYFPKYEALVDYQVECDPATNTTSPFDDLSWKVWPNPARGGSTFIQWPGIQPGEIILVDALGREVSHTPVLTGPATLPIGVPDQPGIYVLISKDRQGTILYRERILVP